MSFHFATIKLGGVFVASDMPARLMGNRNRV